MLGLRQWSMVGAMAALVVACGGEESGPGNSGNVQICTGTFSPCGGDPVGQWESGEICLEQLTEHPSASCPEATVTSQSQPDSMSWEILPDGTLIRAVTGTLSNSSMIPRDCAGTSCDAFADALIATGNRQGFDTTTAACSEFGTFCRCNVSSKIDRTVTATYVVTGSHLQTTNATGDVFDYDFCRQGDELTVKPSTPGTARVTFRLAN